MVEAAGVEPASEITQRKESTCVSVSFLFRVPTLRTGKIVEPLDRFVSPTAPGRLQSASLLVDAPHLPHRHQQRERLLNLLSS